MRKKIPTGKWYKHGKGDKIFYTPFAEFKREVECIEKGLQKPSPKEVKEKLIEILDKEIDYNYISVHADSGVFVYPGNEKNAGIELPPGTYKYFYNQYTATEQLIPIKFRDDHYVQLSGISDEFVKDFNDFLGSEKIHRELGVIYKEGFLAYGPPGNGKTATLRQLVNSVMPKDSVVIVINEHLPQTDFLQVMRDSLSERLKIFIFEEFSQFTKDMFDMEEILTFCDGENSLDKSLIIATTNYPELLPSNIVERRSRFDKFYEFDNPNKQERKLLLNHYLMRESLEEEILETNNMSIADIKEVCLLSHKRKISVKDSCVNIKKQMELAKKHFKKSGKLGL